MNIAIVTGASSGLGGCFVHLLDEQEKLDEIWVIARREQRLNALKSQVKTPLRVLPLDLSDKAAVRKMCIRDRPASAMAVITPPTRKSLPWSTKS